MNVRGKLRRALAYGRDIRLPQYVANLHAAELGGDPVAILTARNRVDREQKAIAHCEERLAELE
jgi:hypothetical protein